MALEGTVRVNLPCPPSPHALTPRVHHHIRGDNGSRKAKAGPANKEHILTEYRSILAGPKVAEIGQMSDNFASTQPTSYGFPV